MPEVQQPLKHRVTKKGNDEYSITYKHTFDNIYRHMIAEGCTLSSILLFWYVHERETRTDPKDRLLLEEIWEKSEPIRDMLACEYYHPNNRRQLPRKR